MVNTGWSGGEYGQGIRIPLDTTRRIIAAIHSGEIKASPGRHDTVFGFEVKTQLPGVDSSLLWPARSWRDRRRYHEAKERLARRFRENFLEYEESCSVAVREAGPVLL